MLCEFPIVKTMPNDHYIPSGSQTESTNFCEETGNAKQEESCEVALVVAVPGPV